MKNILIISVLLIISFGLFGQNANKETSQLPDIELKDINGKTINISQLNNDNNPFIICFWKTCCHTPNKLLSAINEVYDEWQEETGVKMFVISVDDSRSTNRVKPFVNGKGWEYDIILDPNSNLKRAMNVYSVPHLFLYNGKGELVWQKTSFQDGDEDTIYDRINEAVNE